MTTQTKYLTMTLSNGEVWGVPIEVVARDRAKHYADEFDGDIERSLKEDTLPLFESEWWNAEDWAANNMNWSDVSGHIVKISEATPIDLAEEWYSQPKKVRDATPLATGRAAA